MLIHLNYEEALRFIRSCAAAAKALVILNHYPHATEDGAESEGCKYNSELDLHVLGRRHFRKLNLYLPPFSFPPSKHRAHEGHHGKAIEAWDARQLRQHVNGLLMRHLQANKGGVRQALVSS